MKTKLISTEVYLANIKPNTQISFGTISPFPVVSFPQDKALFASWYGNLSLGSGPSIAMGTLEVARRGDGTVILDFDQYPNYSTGTPSVLEVVGPKKPFYHWSADLPSHLKSQSPQWVSDLVLTEKKKREE